MRAVLGIDLGTSSVKVIALSDSGQPLTAATASYPLSHPGDGQSEQDPDHWWRATVHAVQSVTAACRRAGNDIVAIGLSGQMHGLVAIAQGRCSVPADGAALRPCILWNDQRAVAECAELESILGGPHRLVQETGNGAFPGFTLPKLLWMRRHEPALWNRIGMVLLPKDYLRWRLTGEFATDVGDASGTSFFDPASRTWNPGILGAANINPEWLPVVHESAAVAGRLTPAAAELLGLSPHLPVAAGSGDNMAGAVGAGVIRPGTCLVALGTSGVVLSPTSHCQPDLPTAGPVGRTHTMCHADGTETRPGGWCITGCTLSAGYALQWAHDSLWPDVSYETLYAEAASTLPGAEGLVFLPQLTGERCPFPDAKARAAWVGLSARHTRGHLIRAILEGVTFTLEQIYRIQRTQGASASEVSLGGGGARAPFWRQLVADIFDLPVITSTSEDTPALGAAILGGVAAAVWPDVPTAVRAAVVTRERAAPREASRYADARQRFAEVYAGLRPFWQSTP